MSFGGITSRAANGGVHVCLPDGEGSALPLEIALAAEYAVTFNRLQDSD